MKNYISPVGSTVATSLRWVGSIELLLAVQQQSGLSGISPSTKKRLMGYGCSSPLKNRTTQFQTSATILKKGIIIIEKTLHIGKKPRITGGIAGIVKIGGIVVKRQAVTWIVMSCLAGEVRVQQVVLLLLKNFRFYQHRFPTMWRFTFAKCFIWSKISPSLHTNCFVPRYPRFFCREHIEAGVVFGTNPSCSSWANFSRLDVLEVNLSSLKFCTINKF